VPDIQNVSGVITFDDLLALTTPPGQEVTVGVLNPGVALHDGTVRYQLLAGGAVAIEAAHWGFAAGVLTLDPATLRFDAPTSTVMLRLSEVDAMEVVRTLSIKDITIDGKVQGQFPVVLSATAAVVTNGTIEAVGPGSLAYTGAAGEDVGGLGQVAFDALRDFRFESLSAIINGDLAGDIDVDVQMSGLHPGKALDLSPIVHLPGGGRATAENVPFMFNVAIHAPFRQLVDTSQGILDPRRYVRTVKPSEAPVPETPPVDPVAPPSP
jgi:hypothetical protein